MKKRLLAIMLAVILALSALPVTAMAEPASSGLSVIGMVGFKHYPQDAAEVLKNNSNWKLTDEQARKFFGGDSGPSDKRQWMWVTLPRLDTVEAADGFHLDITAKLDGGQEWTHRVNITAENAVKVTDGPLVVVWSFNQGVGLPAGRYSIALKDKDDQVVAGAAEPNNPYETGLGCIQYFVDEQVVDTIYGQPGDNATLLTYEANGKAVKTWRDENGQPVRGNIQFPQGIVNYSGTLEEIKPLQVQSLHANGEYGYLCLNAFFNQEVDSNPNPHYFAAVTVGGTTCVRPLAQDPTQFAPNQLCAEFTGFEGEFPFSPGTYTMSVYSEEQVTRTGEGQNATFTLNAGVTPVTTAQFTLSDVIQHVQVFAGRVNMGEDPGQPIDSITAAVSQNPRKVTLSGKVVSKDSEGIDLSLLGLDGNWEFMSGTYVHLEKVNGTYVAKEYTDGTNDQNCYNTLIPWLKVDKANQYSIDASGITNIDAEVATAPAEVKSEVSTDNLTEEQKQAVADVEKALTPSEGSGQGDGVKIADESQKALEDEANKAVESLTAQQIESAKNTAKTELNAGDKDVRIVVQTSLDIVLKEVKTDSGSKSIKIDITPVVQVVATTADENETINLNTSEGKNAVVINGGQKKTMTVTKPVTVEIPLPNGFIEAASAYVKHTKGNGSTYFYTGSITNNLLSFLNPHGFSEFEISAESGAAAEVSGGGENTVGYASVAEAIANASGKTVTIKNADAIKNGVTVSSKVENVTIVLPEGTTSITINGKTYTSAELKNPITIQSTGGGNSSSGGSGTTTTPQAQTTATVKPAINGTTATAEVSASTASALVQGAKQSGAEEVTVKVPAADVDAVEVSLPASAVSSLGRDTKASLKVETQVADITIPNGSLASLGGTSGSVTISAAVNNDETVSITVKKDNTTVTSLPQPMKTAIPAPDITDTTVAVLVNKDGAETIIPKSISGKDEISLLLGGSAKIKLKENAKTFTDTQGHWADKEGAVSFVSSRELFQGVSDASFAPDQPMTRGMMVTVLHRLESKPKGSTANFTDIPDGAYYAEAVAWGNEKGIVQGTGANSFTPNQNVTREQLATFLYRYASKYGVDTAGRTSLTSFPDSGNVSGYAKDAMEWTYHTGLIKGTDNGRLDPTGSATRGQVAAILMRFVEYINK